MSSSYLGWLLLCCPGQRPGEQVGVGKMFLGLVVPSTPFILAFPPSEDRDSLGYTGNSTRGCKIYSSLEEQHPGPFSFALAANGSLLPKGGNIRVELGLI